MAIYFFDKNQTLIKIAPDSATFEAIQTQELDDDSLLKDTLSVTVKGDEKLLNAEYMAVKSYTGNAQTFDMYRIVTDSTPDKTMTFTGMSLAPYELNGHILKDLRPSNQSVEYTLNRILDGTDWRLGYIDGGLPNVTTTFYYVSAKEALKELQSLVGCEFVFKVEISGQKITDKWIEIYKEMGNRTKKRFNYGTNALTVVRETNKADIYTALIGRGKGEEISSAEENESGQAGYGRKITFEDIEWSIAKGNPLDKPKGQYYLELPQATQVYGIKNIDGTMSARVGVVDFDDETDKNRLINLTYQQLLVSSRPKVLFKTTVANIGATGIGDTVTIHRHDLNIHYQTRVRKIVRNKLNDNKTQIELGDAVVTSSTKQSKKNNATIKNLTQELERVKVDVTTSQNSADGKNTIFYGSAEPERKRTGDTWFRPHPSINGETQMLVWNGTAWELVLDSSDLSSVSREVEAAISTAEDAKALAVSEAEKALADANKYADQQDALITQQVTNSVSDAISKADQAKQIATDSYNNAVAEAERLTGEQSEAFNKKFEENATAMGTLSQATKDAEAKAQSALTKAGANANLLTTHQNTLDTIKNTTIPNVNKVASDAMAEAKSALSSASSAMDEAKKADGKIADYVTRNGLVNGTTVDSKIDTATGAISRKITTVEGKIDNIKVGGRNLLLNSSYIPYAQGAEVEYKGNLATKLKSPSSTNYAQYTPEVSEDLIQGETYTYSALVAFEGVKPDGIELYLTPLSSYTRVDGFEDLEEGKYGRVYFTRKASTDGSISRPHLHIRGGDGYVYFTKWKLEKGSIPTDWSPAPEDNYTQEEFAIFESTYNEDVKGINSTLTDLSNKKLDGTTYTTFYNNEYKKTAQGVTDTYSKVNKIIDANGNSTDAFAKAVYDKNATRQSADFKTVTDGLVKTATYTAGINGVKQSITTVQGKLENLEHPNLVLDSNKLVENSNYLVASYNMTENLIGGETYTITVWGDFPNGLKVYHNGSGGANHIASTSQGNNYLPSVGNGKYEVTTTVYNGIPQSSTPTFLIYQGGNNTTNVKVRIDRVMITKGKYNLTYQPAPSDMLGKEDFKVFKNDYEDTAKSVERRLTAIDSGKQGSVIYNANEALSTAQGNTNKISSVRGDLDSLSGGGGNYAVDTSNKMKYQLRITAYSGLLDQDNKLTTKTKYTLSELDAKVGDWYTASIYIGKGGGFGSSVTVYNQNTGRVRLRGNRVTNGYSSVTFQVLEGDTEFNFYLGNETGNNGTYYVEAKEFQIEKGKIRTAWKPAISEQMGKAEFTIFKNDYEETAKSVERRLTAIDSTKEGSFLTRLNKTESTASGNSKLITTINSNYVTQSNIDETILSDKQIKDTRNYNRLPSWYMENYPKQQVREFKLNSVMGLSTNTSGTYGVLTTDVQWGDTSGGTVKQQFINDDATFTRTGNSNGASWGAWATQVDTSNKTYQKVTETSSLYERVIGSSSEASVKQNMARIVMTDSAFKTEIVDKQDLRTAMASGTSMTSDPYFNKGNNGLSVYDNGKTGTISIIRQSTTGTGMPAPVNKPYRLAIAHKASSATSPHRGGVVKTTMGWAGGTVVVKFTAQLPVGRSFSYHNNSLGTGYTHGWLTDNKGTGKWETYMYYYRFGTGSVTSFGFLAVTGASSAFTWYLSEYDIINVNETSASKITQLSDNINLKVSKADLISEINLSKEGVRIVGKNIQLDGNVTMTSYFQVPNANIKDLAVNKITGTNAQFTTMITKGLTANVITSNMIKADDAMFTKLFATKLATDKLVAQGAWITNANIVSLDASKITAGTINSARINAGQIVTNGLSANVIKSTHIESSTGLIDKIFASDAYITRLTGKTAFINSIKAIDISASKITTGTLNASKVKVINLDANNITANKTAFVQSVWNSLESSISINSTGLLSKASDGSQVYLQNGVVGARNPSGATIGQIGYAYESSSPWYSMQVSHGSHFQIRMSRGTGQLNKQAFYIISGGTESYLNTDNIYLNPSASGRVRVQGSMNVDSEMRIEGMTLIRSRIEFLNGGSIESQSANSNMVIGSSNKMIIYTNGTNALEFDANNAVFRRKISENSDVRLKTNIVDMPIDSLDAIRNMEIKKFDYLDGRTNYYGIIAQQAQQYLPELINTDSEGYLMVDKSAMTYVNMHAIQQLDSKVDVVDDEVAQLKAQVASLQKELALLKGD